MNIQNISKEKRSVIVELSADELATICNLFFSQFSEQKDKENYLILSADYLQIFHILSPKSSYNIL